MSARKLDSASLPGWPRLMRPELAAAYIDVSAPTLRALPIRRQRIGGAVLYDRLDLDHYADTLAKGSAERSVDDWLGELDADAP